MRFGFIRQQMKAYHINLLCRVMGVSRRGFYSFVHRGQGRGRGNGMEERIKARMRFLFHQSRSSYGSRRSAKKLQAEGDTVGRGKAPRLMRELGLRVQAPRRYQTTNSRHAFPVAANLLDRRFEAPEPNRVWTADITYVWTLEGWLYLAVVMDLFSRQILGWAMEDNMRIQLTQRALAMAYWRRKPAPGLLHHSDRGSQYDGHDYQQRLKQYGMTASMSRKGDRWDNAPTERFFRSLKSERLASRRFQHYRKAEVEILDYITFYNQDRLHSTLGFRSPNDFEAQRIKQNP